MSIKRKVIIERFSFPVDIYSYNVMLATSVDGGQNYYYCGVGKFAKTFEEAREIKTALEKENEIKAGYEL